MIAEALRLVLAVSFAAAPAAELPSSSVPPPRVVAPPSSRPPPPRPIAVATVGLGALTLISSVALLGLGVHTWRLAPGGRTEGEAHAYVHNGKNLVAVGAGLSIAGLALLAGGIVWIVRDRRRARGSLARR
jgi:hypothetical protein